MIEVPPDIQRPVRLVGRLHFVDAVRRSLQHDIAGNGTLCREITVGEIPKVVVLMSCVRVGKDVVDSQESLDNRNVGIRKDVGMPSSEPLHASVRVIGNAGPFVFREPYSLRMFFSNHEKRVCRLLHQLDQFEALFVGRLQQMLGNLGSRHTTVPGILRRDADAGVQRSWTAAERLYLSDYLKSGARGKASATAAGKYTLLEAVVGKGQRLVMGDEIEPVPGLDGRPGYRLTDEGVKDGIARLTWVTGYVQRPWSAPGDERGGVRGS